MTNTDNRWWTRHLLLLLGLTALLATVDCAARAPKGAASVALPATHTAGEAVPTPQNKTQQKGTHILPQGVLATKYFGGDAPWFEENIPFFDCSDPELTQVYYYRWQLYKSHLKDLGRQGYIVTEFLDDVGWAKAPEQSLNDATAFHIHEGRWLRDPRYVDDYEDYMESGGGNDRHFSEAIADAVYADYLATGDRAQALKNLDGMRRIYGQWDDHYDSSKGLYYIVPLLDATEYTIASIDASGGKDGFNGGTAFRPTINSFMYADALAISKLAALAGDRDAAKTYAAKAAAIRETVEKDLWNDSFQHFVDRYQVSNQYVHYWDFIRGRELAGYTPWYFDLPDADPKYSAAWTHILSPAELGGPFGIRTVEPTYQYYMKQYRYDGATGQPECQWNGPSWPFQTTLALGGMANLLNDYSQNVVHADDYVRLLKQYAHQHYLNGQLDLQEDYNPDTGKVIVGLPRSHHYNHSGFDDLIITGLAGLRPRADNTLEVHPLIPADPKSPNAINYLCLENVPYHGQSVTILYDRDGKHYGKGAGLSVYVNGKRVVAPSALGKKTVPISAPVVVPAARPVDIAVNFAQHGFPMPSASANNTPGDLYQAVDGRVWFWPKVRNYWTNTESTSSTDWYSVDFGRTQSIHSARLYFYGDGAKFAAPTAFTLQYWTGTAWADVPSAHPSPAAPLANGENTVTFPAVQTSQLRAVFTNPKDTAVALVEMKVLTTAAEAAPPPATDAAAQRALNARTVDRLLPGDPSSEKAHSVTGQNSHTGEFHGRSWRDAEDGGVFSFILKVSGPGPFTLCSTYWGGDVGGRVFDISLDGTKIATQTLDNTQPGEFFDVDYPVPVALTQGKSTITVTFQAHPGQFAGGLFGCRLLGP